MSNNNRVYQIGIFSPSRMIVIVLIVLAVSLLLTSCPAQTEESTGPAQTNGSASVDDLFSFYIENWVCEIDLPPVEMWRTRLEGIDELYDDFREDVISAEERFGHLPEYWELRSIIDTRPQDENRGGDGFLASSFDAYTIFSHLRLNTEMLEKALELDPSRGSVQWLISCIDVADKYPESLEHGYDEYGGDDDYVRLKADTYVAAASVEPSNACYPIFEAPYHTAMGDLETALERLAVAGNCDYCALPDIFPSTYAIEHMKDFEDGKGVFEDLNPHASYILYVNFYTGNSPFPDYIQLRNTYRTIIVDRVGKVTWKDDFTSLHRAACRLGMNENYDSLSYRSSTLQINNLIAVALDLNEAADDRDLECALAVIAGEVERIRKMGDVMFDALSPFHLYISFVFKKIAEWRYQQDPVFKFTSEFVEGFPEMYIDALPGRIENDIFKEHIFPIFEGLYDFDYSNPNMWYETWFEEMAPKIEDFYY